jgi:hypothetical protein
LRAASELSLGRLFLERSSTGATVKELHCEILPREEVDEQDHIAISVRRKRGL